METKENQSDKVDKYMQKFEHPLKDVMIELRKIIMSSHDEIGEEVKWNAPTFFYKGEMEPSNPKKYLRYIAVSNVHYKDHIMLVLPHGDRVDDGSGFLEGKYTDGRRLLRFYSIEDVNDKKEQLQKLIKATVLTIK